MNRILTRQQLHRLLKERGHGFWCSEPADAPIDVCPPPETYLTIGLDADGALKPAYRDRYFACVRGDDDDPRLLHATAFTLHGHFATAAELNAGNNLFVMGPVRWLPVRVRRFEQLLLWPKGGFRGDDGLGFLFATAQDGRIDQAPHLARWFRQHAPEFSRLGAVGLDFSDLGDCQVIWEAANLVGVWGYDFFLSDPEGHEVYLLHHHDKLVVSIPDAQVRRGLLAELAEQTDVFDDCSGYTSEADDELFGQ